MTHQPAPHRDARDRDLFAAGECEAMHEGVDIGATAAVFLAFDDVNALLIPSTATHVAYYGNGPFANLGRVHAQCPGALLSPTLLRPAVALLKDYVAWEHGISWDVEPTLFTPAQAAAAAKDAKAQGVMPKIYFPLSWVGQVVSACAAIGLKRDDVQLHSAHWTGVPHICSGISTREWGVISVDSTQFTDHYLNRSLDASLCAAGYYGPWGSPPPPPPPPPPPAHAVHGVTHGPWSFDLGHGAWHFDRVKVPGALGFADKDAWAEQIVQVNMHTGQTRWRSPHEKTWHSAPAPKPATHYVNPFAHVTGLVALRIDMGVDYGGFGPVVSPGNAKVFLAASTGTGWPGGGFIGLALLDGPYEGKHVYLAENVTPQVTTGQTVQRGQVIAILHSTFPHCETGWASGVGTQPLARALGQFDPPPNDPGGWVSAAGASFEHWMVSLGVPPSGNRGSPAHGRMPAGYPPIDPSKPA